MSFRLPHPRSRDHQGQETFLAPPADNQTCNYNTECSNHHLSLSTLRPYLHLYSCIYLQLHMCFSSHGFSLRLSHLNIQQVKNEFDLYLLSTQGGKKTLVVMCKYTYL